MDTVDTTSKMVEDTYKNIVEELGPCIKQLVVVGRTYLKSMHGMVAACGNYNNALSRIAAMADSSTLRGSSDLGSALHHIVDINKEIIAQQSNIMKSLEFDFLAPMETAADKDTKLVEKEQKRFQQMHRRQKEAFEKCISTLKKSRRKKSINTEKQLSQMKLLESSKSRLEEFCDQSLQEAIVQERVLYGTVLEKQCALNKQWLIYHNKGCELLQDNIPHWENLSKTSSVLPDNCFPLLPKPNIENSQPLSLSTIESLYRMDSPVDTLVLRRNINNSHQPIRDSMMSAVSRLESVDADDIYVSSLLRAKSEHNLSTMLMSSSPPNTAPGTPPPRFSRIFEYSGEDAAKNYVRALYPYQPTGSYQMNIEEGDVIEFLGEENATGWQFGDNLTSKKSGWFPLSYTERITNGRSSTPEPISRNGTVARSNHNTTKQRPLPPPPTNERAQTLSRASPIHKYQAEIAEYGTLKRGTQRKMLPVPSPSIRVDDRNGKIPPFHRNTMSSAPVNNSSSSTYDVLRSRADTAQFYSGHLQSMHL